MENQLSSSYNLDQKILNSFCELTTNKIKLFTPDEYEIMMDSTIRVYIINTIKQFFKDFENHKVWLNQDEAIKQSFTEVDSFVDVIDAYLIGFKKIESQKILEWLIELKGNVDFYMQSLTSSANEQAAIELVDNQKIKMNDIDNIIKSINNNHKVHEQPLNQDIKKLMEIFPQFSVSDLKIIYNKNRNNYEATIDELVSIECSSMKSTDKKKDGCDQDLNEDEKKSLKERIVKKYKNIT